MTFQFTTTVTVISKNVITGYDGGNRPIYGNESSPSAGWVLWPQTTTETVVAEDITTDQLEGLAPNGTDLSTISQVTVPAFPGKVYEVQGRPWPWASPLTGTAPGIQVVLKAVS